MIIQSEVRRLLARDHRQRVTRGSSATHDSDNSVIAEQLPGGNRDRLGHAEDAGNDPRVVVTAVRFSAIHAMTLATAGRDRPCVDDVTTAMGFRQTGAWR